MPAIAVTNASHFKISAAYFLRAAPAVADALYQGFLAAAAENAPAHSITAFVAQIETLNDPADPLRLQIFTSAMRLAPAGSDLQKQMICGVLAYAMPPAIDEAKDDRRYRINLGIGSLFDAHDLVATNPARGEEERRIADRCLELAAESSMPMKELLTDFILRRAAPGSSLYQRALAIVGSITHVEAERRVTGVSGVFSHANHAAPTI